jgi:uracil-DNA glycosylase
MMKWNKIQQKIKNCTLCAKELPRSKVVCPPRIFYPKPPKPTQVLFVGVAPPRPGEDFYSDKKDKLRYGLFGVLAKMGIQCKTIDDFLENGLFLLHTAKCPIRNTWKPNKKVSLYCSNKHLIREIESLSPKTVCFLSKGIGFHVMQKMLSKWELSETVKFGIVSKVKIANHWVHFVATKWPGRGWEKETKKHLSKLFLSAGINFKAQKYLS